MSELSVPFIYVHFVNRLLSFPLLIHYYFIFVHCRIIVYVSNINFSFCTQIRFKTVYRYTEIRLMN